MRDDYSARTARKREERRAQTPALPQNLACFRAFALSRVRALCGCHGRIPTRGNEYPSGAGLHGDCRHAYRHWVLHAVVAARGFCSIRLLALLIVANSCQAYGTATLPSPSLLILAT